MNTNSNVLYSIFTGNRTDTKLEQIKQYHDNSYIDSRISEATVLRLANKLHNEYKNFIVRSQDVLQRGKVPNITYKRKVKEFINYLNNASVALQILEDRLKQKDLGSFLKAKELIDYLYQEIDNLRIIGFSFLNRKFQLKKSYEGLVKNIEAILKF